MENANYLPETVYTRIDKDGTPSATGGYMHFGFYPNSRVTDEALLAILNEKAGTLPKNGSNHAWTSYKYYIFNSNEKDFMWHQDVLHNREVYRGVYFTEYRPNDTFYTSEDNCQKGNNYLTGVVYWFKYEPLKWRILDERDGKAWLITDVCIDSQSYRDILWANSYVNSDIRQWLNTVFLFTAFSDRERTAISCEVITNEDEDEENLADLGDEVLPGGNTLDFVHLLSIDEVAEMIPHGERQSVASDYAICQGIAVNPNNGYSVWWLRSPYHSVDPWAQLVGTLLICDFSTGEVGNTDTGIRPALWLKL